MMWFSDTDGSSIPFQQENLLQRCGCTDRLRYLVLVKTAPVNLREVCYVVLPCWIFGESGGFGIRPSYTQATNYVYDIYIYANYAWEVKLFPVFEFSQFPTKEVFIWPTRYSSIHHDALPELVPAFVLGTKNMTSRPANTISSVQRLQLSSPTAVGTSNIKAFSFDKVGWEVITCYRSDMYMYKQTRVIF